MRKISKENIGGSLIKNNDIYQLRDNNTLKNLVLSSTKLHAGKKTRGHKHEGQEEIYFFINGCGEMLVESERIKVGPGDIVLVEGGEFHQVYNTTQNELGFVCVLEGKRNH